MKHTFDEIISRLETVEQIKTTGLFNNQFDNEPTERSINYPSAFVEFSDYSFRSYSKGVQNVDAEITIHVGFSLLDERDTDTVFETLKAVAKSLHGHETECFTPLKRARIVQDTNHDRVQVWQIVFLTTIFDNDMNPENDMIQTTFTALDLTADIDIDSDVIRTGDGVVDPE